MQYLGCVQEGTEQSFFWRSGVFLQLSDVATLSWPVAQKRLEHTGEKKKSFSSKQGENSEMTSLHQAAPAFKMLLFLLLLFA